MLAQLIDAGARALRRRRSWPASFRLFGRAWRARGTIFGRVIVESEYGLEIARSNFGKL